MDSFAKSIKGDVKITVGTVSAPGSYVQQFIPGPYLPTLTKSVFSPNLFISSRGTTTE